jgi:hypothetical protein
MYYTRLTKKGEGFRNSFLLFFILSNVINCEQVKAEIVFASPYDFDIGGLPIVSEQGACHF